MSKSGKQGKRLNPFQHALTRPDTYIGSVVTTVKENWVYEERDREEKEIDLDSDKGSETSSVTDSSSGPNIVLKNIKYNAGLTRIFVEIMSNAIDNKWRSEQHGIEMKRIDFAIDNDPESEHFGWITITNDGYHIPVKRAEYQYEDYRTGTSNTENLYPAEVFFGEMLAGTNFEEDDTRKTSGRNGMGGKAAVIFSSEAIVEHTDPEERKMFVQKYRNNGKERDPPEITAYRGKGYTTFSFLPDYKYFGYQDKMDSDLFSLFKRYIYECAMITGLNVTLNGEKINVKTLSKYVRLFYPDTKSNPMISFTSPNGDECVIVDRGEAEMDVVNDISHVSWVNGIHTRDGGVHVDAWRDAIIPLLVKALNSRKPPKGEKMTLKTTAKELYPYFTLFVRSEVEGAKFDSQTKDRLNSPIIALGEDKDFKSTINDAILKMLKWGFVSLLDEKLSMKDERARSKKEGNTKKRTSYGDKATDANYAGTKESYKCTLYITEGLSAKTFADRLVTAMGQGPDYIGTFAIKGKFINVQNASLREVSANEEVQILKSILNLMTGADYTNEEDRKLLRYGGGVCLFMDQDDDGFHIKGLLLNLFHTLWPSLFNITNSEGEPFIRAFNTAVVMARTVPNKKNNIPTIFYSNPEYRSWYENLSTAEMKRYAIKYYKGLGTHKPGDEKIYVNDPKIILYTLDGEEDKYMDLGFNKKQSEWRKRWITGGMTKPGEIELDEEQRDDNTLVVSGPLSLSNFVDNQLIIYHRMTLKRALPNMYDGFKEGQRKAFYGIMMTKSARKEPVIVENLIGAIKMETGYHHGGKALEDTVKKMAMGFVGSNNIPLLVNDGEFGTRKDGGADASAARYISTKLEDISWTLFSELDSPILEREVEDNVEVEYKMFMPILPMILINGASGVASGYSTDIPCYNPDDLVSWISNWLDSEDGTVEMEALKPWYRGFTGTIELLKKNGGAYEECQPGDVATSWRSRGILERGKNGWWIIREIPVGATISSIKEHIEYLYTGNPPPKSKKKKGEIYIRDVRWNPKDVNSPYWEIKPDKDFIPDMDVAGNFKCLQDVSSLTNMHVIDENGYPRKYSSAEELLGDFCIKRLEYYEKRRRYLLGSYKRELEKERMRHKYVTSVISGDLVMNQNDEILEKDMISIGLKMIEESFDYLLSMQMRSMTVKRVKEIENEIEKYETLIKTLSAKTAKHLWKEDLKLFKTAYAKFLKTRKD